jgi:hypothetical protein
MLVDVLTLTSTNCQELMRQSRNMHVTVTVKTAPQFCFCILSSWDGFPLFSCSLICFQIWIFYNLMIRSSFNSIQAKVESMDSLCCNYSNGYSWHLLSAAVWHKSFLLGSLVMLKWSVEPSSPLRNLQISNCCFGERNCLNAWCVCILLLIC